MYYKSLSFRAKVSPSPQNKQMPRSYTESGACFSVCMQPSPFSCYLLFIWDIHSISQRLISASFPHLISTERGPAVVTMFLKTLTVTSLCKHHPQHHCGASPSFLPWWLSNLFSPSSSAAKQIQYLFSIATTK